MTMLEKITWSFQAKVTGGPSVYATDTEEVDAYDVLEVTIPKDGTATPVDVQPGDDASFLLVTASSYEKIKYTVAADDTEINLEGPLILLGKGAVGLLPESPTSLTFTNTDTTTDNKVSILVGRAAT